MSIDFTQATSDILTLGTIESRGFELGGPSYFYAVANTEDSDIDAVLPDHPGDFQPPIFCKIFKNGAANQAIVSTKDGTLINGLSTYTMTDDKEFAVFESAPLKSMGWFPIQSTQIIAGGGGGGLPETPLAVIHGGSGSTTAAGARTNFSVPSVLEALLVTGANPLTGDQSAGGHKITNLLNPTNPQDAATRAFVEASTVGVNKLGLSGDPARRVHRWQPGDSGFDSFGISISTDNFAGNVNLSGTRFCQFTTASSIGDHGQVFSASPRYRYELKPTSFFRTRLSTLTNQRSWGGFWSGNVYSTDTPGPSGLSGFGFRESTSAGDTTYKCVVSNGVADTIVDSGVLVDGLEHDSFIDGRDPSQVLFYIDDMVTPVATISTTLPSPTTDLYHLLTITTLAAAAATLNVGCVHIES